LIMALLMTVDVPPAWATGVGAIAGAIANYPLQKIFTFSGRVSPSPVPVYILACILTWSLNLFLFVTLNSGFGFSAGIAQIFVTAFVAIGSYGFYRKWVFHD